MRDQGPPQRSRPQQLAGVHGARAVAVLEDDGGVRPTRLPLHFAPGLGLGAGDLLVLRERQTQRLLAQHPGTRAQRRPHLFRVENGRRTDQHRVGTLGCEHLRQVRVAGHTVARLLPEGREPIAVHVDSGHQAYAVGVFAQRGQMAAGDDASGTDDRGTEGDFPNRHTTDVPHSRKRLSP